MASDKPLIAFFGATGGCCAAALARSLIAGYPCTACKLMFSGRKETISSTNMLNSSTYPVETDRSALFERGLAIEHHSPIKHNQRRRARRRQRADCSVFGWRNCKHYHFWHRYELTKKPFPKHPIPKGREFPRTAFSIILHPSLLQLTT